MWKERRKGVTVNLMTQSTYESLLREVEVARGNASQSLLDIGEAAGTGSDWHDNAAFDHANIRHDVDSVRLRDIEAKLRDVEIIKPSKKNDQIGVGNSVIVKFQDQNEEEMFTILGPADTGRQTGWISFESPLGASLMGRQKGETINFAISNQEQKVRIVDILKGNF
jgi:transcription elongation factor GreA